MMGNWAFNPDDPNIDIDKLRRADQRLTVHPAPTNLREKLDRTLGTVRQELFEADGRPRHLDKPYLQRRQAVATVVARAYLELSSQHPLRTQNSSANRLWLNAMAETQGVRVKWQPEALGKDWRMEAVLEYKRSGNIRPMVDGLIQGMSEYKPAFATNPATNGEYAALPVFGGVPAAAAPRSARVLTMPPPAEVKKDDRPRLRA